MMHSADNHTFKILLVEDPLCKRDTFALCNQINQFPRSQVSARIVDLDDAARAVQIFNPDIVLLDLTSIKRKIAFGLAEQLRNISPMLKLVYSAETPPPLLGGNMRVTALSGYSFWINNSLIEKNDIESLMLTFGKVITGDIDMPQILQAEFLSSEDFLSNLTPQQKLTIQLLASGFSNKEIARLADLKVKTVERNIARATQVLGVQGSDHENNKRILLVLEYLRRVDHEPKPETLYS